MKFSDDLITQAQAARERGVTPATMNILVKRGRFKITVVGGQKFLSRAEVKAFVPDPGGRPSRKKSKRSRK